MIILVIDINCILAFKPKCDPPVGANRYGPCAATATLQRVKFQARKAHVTRGGRSIQRAQDQAQRLYVSGLNPRFRSRRKEFRQALVTECTDHGPKCNP